MVTCGSSQSALKSANANVHKLETTKHTHTHNHKVYAGGFTINLSVIFTLI